MRKFLLISITFLNANLYVAAQKKYCADSSIRIAYRVNYSGVDVFNRQDTSGFNLFAGTFTNSTNPLNGLLLFKTSWGDSVYWSKRFYLNNTLITCKDVEAAPSGTVICNGVWGNSNDLFLCRIDTNGNLLWAKRYRFGTIGAFTAGGNGRNSKNLIVFNSAIYVTGNFGTQQLVIAKLDLNGNILWSKNYGKPSYIYTTFTNHAPVIINDTVFLIINVNERSGGITYDYPVITKLSNSSGSLIESLAFKIQPDSVVKGFWSDGAHVNTDNSLSILGRMRVPHRSIPGELDESNFTYNLLLDNYLNFKTGWYYKFPTQIYLQGQFFTFDFNQLDQSIFLYDVSLSNDKYFVGFNADKKISRTRKFLLPSNLNMLSSINIDAKQNLHFTFDYSQNGRGVIEYARLSDIAPSNTATCFGIDTNILRPVPFFITKETYNWDFENSNVLNSFSVNLIEEPEIINKQIICKQVSYCDSIKILGPQRVCLSNPDVRYSIFRNPQCLKEIDWNIDTSYASVISMEADSAINIQIKKFGSFYIKAIVKNCVVNDSFQVTVPQPLDDLQLTKSDTVLCPGETIVLQVNTAYQSYQWQDGSTQSFYNVTTPGLYSVTASDSCGYAIKDSVQISADNSRIPFNIYYKICPYDSVMALFPSTMTDISWQPSSSGLLRGDLVVLFPLQTTPFTISAKSISGCEIQKQVIVEIDQCPEWIYFPTAFTPNNNGLNDIFRPGVSGHLQSYILKVYNRWGQIVFSSTSPFSGWDGTIKGIPQNGGVFVFMCYYNFMNKPVTMLKGSLLLIR